MRQFLLTPAAGKRMIGLALSVHPAVRASLHSGTLVIVAGTTNGYVAEEVLKSLGRNTAFPGRDSSEAWSFRREKPLLREGCPMRADFRVMW